MEIKKTELEGAYIIVPDIHGDNRGWFMETYSKQKLEEVIGVEFVQDNHSYSSQKGVLRGLHCQLNPYCQSKLIRCTRGKIYDVIVDIRKGSPTYKKWIKVELSAKNKIQLFIPKGFLHGFITLTDDVEVQYKVDEYYNKECDRSVKYNDPEFRVDWEYENPILSEKDKNAPLYKDSDCEFKFER
ncbi:MAG: dTDP-4-dehydrorhamnose 3,5-epimerase [Clostridia bacterium]|nr:dTDP-4-dehydrorhamnose 3,5-epimerase [Clostridia bacterium]